MYVCLDVAYLWWLTIKIQPKLSVFYRMAVFDLMGGLSASVSVPLSFSPEQIH